MNEAILAIAMNLVGALTAPAEATLLFAGDAMMHQAQIDAARMADGAYDYSGCFDAIAPIVGTADYAVVNLETPIGTHNFTGYPCFNAPASYVDALREAGFDLFLTANNHTLDRRDKGLLHTLTVLDSAHVDHIGTYRDKAARAAVLPMVRNINGFKVGFLNYTYGTNGFEVKGDVVVDYIDHDRIDADVRMLREAGAELIAACMHWGEEYVLLPVASERRHADFLRRCGVEMIIGGHPHVVQPLRLASDRYAPGRVTVYSLGNLISNMKTRDTRGGAMAEVRLRRDSVGKAYVDTAFYHLVYTVPPSAAQRNFAVMPIDSVPRQWAERARAFQSALKP